MNVAKEALQRYLLAALQREGLLTHAAFIGGTALRLLHELPRYSEDLDFIWTNKNAESQLAEWTKYLPKAIRALGALPEIDAKNKSKDDAKVQKRGHSIVINATAPAFTAFAPHGILSLGRLEGETKGFEDRRHLLRGLGIIFGATRKG